MNMGFYDSWVQSNPKRKKRHIALKKQIDGFTTFQKRSFIQKALDKPKTKGQVTTAKEMMRGLGLDRNEINRLSKIKKKYEPKWFGS